jgi:hypothetical protein
MSLTEGKRVGEFILSEARGQRSREKGTLAAAAAALVPGTVLGKLTSGGKLLAYSDAAVDGTGVAIGILYGRAPDSASDQAVTYLARDCEVMTSLLTGLDANGRADLLALGIICRP